MNRMANALRDAEYDLDNAGEKDLAFDAWQLKRKLEKDPEYVPTRLERSSLADMEWSGKLMDDRAIKELARRRDP